MMGKKLGLISKQKGDAELINELLILMRKYKRDYTNTFFKLSNNENTFAEDEERDWFIRWKERTEKQDRIKNSKDNAECQSRHHT